MQHLHTNTTLQGGKYRIERVLGQGGFGITYLAVQTSLERNVAIKEFFMKGFCSRDNTMLTTGNIKLVEQCRKKFIKEARNLARLSHPNIIGVIDVFEENETVYYVMPYLTGGSLEDYVKTHGPLSESEAMKYVKQIASALKYMHEEQNICHYDVKPANILLDNKGNAVLIDFGISKNYDASGHETTTTPIGMSEGFAPIEQYQQNVEEFSPVSDVYALGATLYFLVHGKRPVSAVNRASGTELMISEQLAQEIKDVINASMQVSKRERAKSVDVFLKEVSFSEQSINTSVESVAKDEETIIASEELERDRSFEMLLKRAESGDAEAQEILISRYNYGVGVWKKNDDTEKKGNSDESRRYGSNRGSDYQTYVSLKGTNGWYKVLAFCVTFIPFLFFWSYNFHNIISFLKSYFTNTWAAFVFWWLLPEFALSLWYPLRGAICYIINRNNPRLSYHGIIVTEFLEEERNWRNWIPLIIFNIIVLIIFVYVNAVS